MVVYWYYMLLLQIVAIWKKPLENIAVVINWSQNKTVGTTKESLRENDKILQNTSLRIYKIWQIYFWMVKGKGQRKTCKIGRYRRLLSPCTTSENSNWENLELHISTIPNCDWSSVTLKCISNDLDRWDHESVLPIICYAHKIIWILPRNNNHSYSF